MDSTPKKRGRPRSATQLTSAKVNYQALAWQVKRLIDDAAAQGRKIKIKDAVRKVMLDSIALRNANKRPTLQNLVNVKIKTHYDETRKILARWKKAGIN